MLGGGLSDSTRVKYSINGEPMDKQWKDVKEMAMTDGYQE